MSQEEASMSMSSDDQINMDAISVIAKPLVIGKSCDHFIKLVKKSAKQKTLRRGVKEVVKSIRKGTKGIVIMAGDISPIDVLTHVPVLCEDAGIKYVFVPSKAALGAAGYTRRPTCCVLVPKPAKGEESDVAKYYEKCKVHLSETA